MNLQMTIVHRAFRFGMMACLCGCSASNGEDGDASAGAAAGGAGPSGGTGATSAASGAGGFPASDGGSATDAPRRTIGYLPTYRGSLADWATVLDFSKLTHVNIAFAEVDGSGNVSIPDPSLGSFASAAHAAGAKVCIAIGGASTIDNPGLYDTLLQDGNRDGFVQKLAGYLALHNLDCVDVDLEGNSVNARYGPFVVALRKELEPQGRFVTAAVAQWFAQYVTDAALEAFAFINVMAYDLCSFWLSTPCQHSSLDAMVAELDYWTGRGVPRAKIAVGVPFYGYRWQDGAGEAISYADVVASYGANQDDWFEALDASVVYNSRATIQEKARRARNYGGIMIWELGQDAPGNASLLAAIDAEL